ncbi:hypothetical protein FA95DRAFT_1604781 [Auriscalpium vulgare]|uniref:Uncharacterized protein n=1 Tax=Auriscalpium vulgare TaxID=40419 RepID=A0ACB8RXY4_9AGAM|nr:hypothetical protein FA95DRAFT_1604781 [Auriscalpium vulgare]
MQNAARTAVMAARARRYASALGQRNDNLQPVTNATIDMFPGPAPTLATALEDFNVGHMMKEHLSFRKGEVIEVLQEHENNEWQGRLNYQIGLFPAHYVQKHVPGPPRPPALLPVLPSQSYQQSTQPVVHSAPAAQAGFEPSGFYAAQSQLQPPHSAPPVPHSSSADYFNGIHSLPGNTQPPQRFHLSPQLPASGLPQIRFAKALYAYNEDGSDPKRLALFPGLVVEVLSEPGGGWYYGRRDETYGSFPASYVQVFAGSPKAAVPGGLPAPLYPAPTGILGATPSWPSPGPSYQPQVNTRTYEGPAFAQPSHYAWEEQYR